MRLIDAEALKTIKSIQSADFNSIETIRQWIDSAPTIDTTIDIVRCKDCKYKGKVGDLLVCRIHEVSTRTDDYCSRGERSEE